MTSQLTLDLWNAIPESDKKFLNLDDATGHRMYGEFHVRIEGWVPHATDVKIRLQYYRERDNWTIVVQNWKDDKLLQMNVLPKGTGSLLWLFLCGYALPMEELDGGEVLNKVPEEFAKLSEALK
ncbi:MAG: SKIP/SNW1 family protein [Candidatus Thermoplasmatota archaeon]|nr:SKIP/SNW1 family protein [Candidatus Thermoplasmatota archaeon]